MAKSEYKGELLEFVRVKFDLTGANTFSTTSINVPTGRSTNQAMLIHRIEYDLDPNEKLDSLTHDDEFSLQLTLSQQTALIGLDNSNLIDRVRFYELMTTSGGTGVVLPIVHTFNPPIPIAKSVIHLSGNTVAQGDADSFSVRIGYTIAKLDSETFLEALVE